MSSKEEYFIYNYPSSRGMGSDSDTCLISDENLRKVMSDVEIAFHLNNCTTYDMVSDLIRLPESVTVSVEQIHMKNTIFHVYNQFLCARDIIVGEALFNRFFVDLSEYEGKLGRWYTEKTVYEFMDFDLKHVAENHFSLFYEVRVLLEAEKNKIDHFLSKGYPEDECIQEARATIAKFESPPKLEDRYYQHFYWQKYSEYRGFMDEYVREEIEEDNIDHTLCAYRYPIMPDTFACKVKRDRDTSNFLTYGELFKKGTDIKHLVADYTVNMEDGFDNPQIDLALRSVFGYD